MSDADDGVPVYVRRDQTGEVVSISLEADAAHPELLERGAPALQRFMQRFDHAADSLARSDTDMSRVLEDVIDLLIHNDVIRFTDLPAAAQAKLLNRRKMRQSLTASLLSDDEKLF